MLRPYPSDDCMLLVAFLEGLAGKEGLRLTAPTDENGDLTGPVRLVTEDGSFEADSLWACLAKAAEVSGHPALIEVTQSGAARRKRGLAAEAARN